jgi:hypothetical protein
VVSTCEWRPEYACYADATCEVQDDGACGWTETDELRDCLAGANGGGSCDADADCRLVDDYCQGCNCVALGPGEGVPPCSEPPVQCLRQPCEGLAAVCQDGRCVAR